MNMNLKKLTLGALLALLPLLSNAHPTLTESTPAADTTVHAVPEAIRLVFKGPVRLARVEVLRNDQTLATDFRPASEAIATYRIKPQGMGSGDFTVTWTAVGADGHTVNSSFGFVVAPVTADAAN